MVYKAIEFRSKLSQCQIRLLSFPVRDCLEPPAPCWWGSRWRLRWLWPPPGRFAPKRQLARRSRPLRRRYPVSGIRGDGRTGRTCRASR